MKLPIIYRENGTVYITLFPMLNNETKFIETISVNENYTLFCASILLVLLLFISIIIVCIKQRR